ncbi:MAG TPA: hypothetical protein VFW33_20640, partial [Gemmataceae bacterium]|nr:hypothetical protein [Gemmataceae bacterium]
MTRSPRTASVEVAVPLVIRAAARRASGRPKNAQRRRAGTEILFPGGAIRGKLKADRGYDMKPEPAVRYARELATYERHRADL